MSPLDRLKHHVTGAIERGEKEAIVERRAPVTRTIKGAACWASYIINGDASGLEPREKAVCDAWLKHELCDGEEIVDCADESHFSWHYALHTGQSEIQGGDLLEYMVLETRR